MPKNRKTEPHEQPRRISRAQLITDILIVVAALLFIAGRWASNTDNRDKSMIRDEPVEEDDGPAFASDSLWIGHPMYY